MLPLTWKEEWGPPPNNNNWEKIQRLLVPWMLAGDYAEATSDQYEQIKKLHTELNDTVPMAKNVTYYGGLVAGSIIGVLSIWFLWGFKAKDKEVIDEKKKLLVTGGRTV